MFFGNISISNYSLFIFFYGIYYRKRVKSQSFIRYSSKQQQISSLVVILKEILCVRLIIYTQASSNKMSNDITPKRIVDFCIPSFSLNSTRLADNIFICVMLDYFIIWTLHTEAKPSQAIVHSGVRK